MRQAGRPCPVPGRCCAGSATRSMSSPIWASTSGYGWPGRCRRRPPGGWSGWHREWTRPRSGPAPAEPPSGSGTGWPAARSSSAYPGWCRARARTPCSARGRRSSPPLRARPAGRCCCWSGMALTGPNSAGWPPGWAWPARSCSPGRFPGRICRLTTTRVTCSRCPAAPGAAAWMSRDWGSSTWRHPRPACRSSAATPAARRTPSRLANRVTSCPAATWQRSRAG